MAITIDSPVQYVPRVGPAMAKKLERLEIFTAGDLLWHAPFRYNDFSQTAAIGRARIGETVTIRGEVLSFVNLLTKNGRKMQVATVSDGTGRMDIIWFNQPYLLTVIRPGVIVNAAGEVTFFSRKLAMMAPDYELVDPEVTKKSLNTGRLVPVYPETEGITSKWLRARISYLLAQDLHRLPDHLPETVKTAYAYPDLHDAVGWMHFPDTKAQADLAKARLAFDELFFMQLQSQINKRIWQTTQTAPVITQTTLEPFYRNLPFELTPDQTNAIGEALGDMQRHYPMNRLLEGDVGAGKTVVAAALMYAAWKKRLKSILMAPTQILAEQHYRSLESIFASFDVTIRLVTSNTNKALSKKNDSSTVSVGTHALLSDKITLDNVGLVVIDEQQRFGVAQRGLLAQKSTGAKNPHILTMTATPIPRSIALAVWGNLDVSVIHQMPKGRQTIKTWVVPQEKRDAAYAWIKKEISDHDAQTFIVCPLIDESETMAAVKSVNAEYDRLRTKVFPGLRVALLHGRMKAAEKTGALEAFRDGKTDILVSTPVVEVGIDIPRATIMLIEDADRFGLSQLHQLRGRVGRRSQQAYCLLFTGAEGAAVTRLKSLETVHNGPELAEIDLKLRGPGELFGTRQHGLPKLKFASIMDMDLVKATRDWATRIIGEDPELIRYPLLREKLERGTIREESAQN